MSGEDITNIIISFGLVGWIPIYFLFGGITKVICAFKGKDENPSNKSYNDKNNETEKNDECGEK